MASERPDGDSVPPEAADAESGRAAFVAALRVRRNATVGLAAGLVLALGAFVLFVLLPGSQRSPALYVGLAFVLAMSTAGLVAFLLTLGRAVRLSRRL
ncbi:hypothetical protein C475_04296 [Halosimplex carlsbadense 2-9-1]|uniref:Uncharacterized protein n=1 Tax=Halosimplex carlsbadense 2-9-1 TaxID=797114 RepID=M0D2A2_9EURY|nr:hypothetical protein [Halosimplex carlsbadense]ELZ28827.1 hypothetical protein C475_04296 [Halosimplex carlsbadense 2-9-1]